MSVRARERAQAPHNRILSRLAPPRFGLGTFAGAIGGFVAALVKLGCESVVAPPATRTVA